MSDSAGFLVLTNPLNQSVLRSCMQDIQKRIDEIETQAAESALIADLATDHEARIYNGRLARELREFAMNLRKQAQITNNVRLSFVGTVVPSSDDRAR
jgi:hypothetical protein